MGEVEMTVPKWLSFLSPLHPVYQQSWPPGMPLHTPLLSDWCFFPKVLSMVLSAHGFSHNKSWMHHGKNRVYAIWNRTRQLLLFLVFFQLYPSLFLYLSFLDAKQSPLILGNQENQEMLLGEVTCSVAAKEDEDPTVCNSHLPFFFIKTPKLLTASPICHSTCTSQSWVYQEYLAENKGWEPEFWPLDNPYSHVHETCFHQRALCHQWACLTTNRGFSRGKIFLICRVSGFSSAIYYKALTSY